MFGVIYSLNLRLPTRFIILDKAIATLASAGVELYPDFNVFEVAKPYARSLLVSRYTPQRMLTRARRESFKLASIFAEYPYQLHDVLEQVRDGQIEVGFVHKGLDEFMQKIDVAINRLIIAFVVAAGLIGSSLIGVFATSGPQILGLERRLRVRLLPRRACSGSGCCGGSSAPGGSDADRGSRSARDRSPRRCLGLSAGAERQAGGRGATRG